MPIDVPERCGRSVSFFLSSLFVFTVWTGLPVRAQTAPASPPPLTSAATPPASATLSLDQAIQSALEHNLNPVVARLKIAQSRGQAQVSLASLMPNLFGSVSQTSQTSNLAAFGLGPGTFPGIRPFVGPYPIFDARIQLVQTIFNFSSLRRYQADRSAVELAKEQARLAEQQIVSQTALGYIRWLEAGENLNVARANVDLSQSLFDLARNQKNAGVADGVDVTRAETRLAQDQLKLQDAERDLSDAMMRLQRITGTEIGKSMIPADKLVVADAAPVAPESLLPQAEKERPEVVIAQRQLDIEKRMHSAARGDLYPTLEFNGNYGSSGRYVDDYNYPTRGVAIKMNVPIFNGGKTYGEIRSTRSLLQQAERSLDDTRQQVNLDVRLAEDELTTALKEVQTAQKALGLAEKELTLARDRFAEGIGSNIDVVQAQAGLAQARYGWISALARLQSARLNERVAIGRPNDFRF